MARSGVTQGAPLGRC